MASNRRNQEGKGYYQYLEEFSDNLDEKWENEITDFFYKNRVIAYLCLGLIAVLLSLAVGTSTSSVVFTSLLYLAILFVYIELRNLQQSQNEILRSERRALVQIGYVDFSSAPCLYHVANYGNGYATGLSVALKIQIPSKSDSSSKVSFRFLTRVRDTDQEFQSQEDTLPPTDDLVKFQGTPHIRLNGISHTVEDAMNKFTDDEIDRINFQIALVYANSLGEVGHRNLTEKLTVSIKGGMDFQEMMAESAPLGGYERDVMFKKFDINDVIHTQDPEDLREPGVL